MLIPKRQKPRSKTKMKYLFDTAYRTIGKRRLFRELGLDAVAATVFERVQPRNWTLLILGYVVEIQIMTEECEVTSHSKLETAWTTLPVLIVAMIAVPSLSLIFYTEYPAYEEISLTDEYKTRVTGHQWFWNYISDKLELFNFSLGYEIITNKIFNKTNYDSYLLAIEDILAIGGARLLEVDNAILSPLRSKLSFLITSSDVLHAWTIPSLGIKLDAIPGRLSSLSIFPTLIGTFFGQCSEICGIGHGFMPIKLYII